MLTRTTGPRSTVRPGKVEEAAPLNLRGTAISPDAPPLFRWDNWTTDLGGSHLGRFTLEAPRTPNPDERHGSARIGFYLPTAKGFDRFSGVVPDSLSWSGSAINLSRLGRAADLDGLRTLTASAPPPDMSKFLDAPLEAFRSSALLVPYTSPYVKAPAGFETMFRPQALSLAYKRAGELSFRNHGIVLDPYAGTVNRETLKYYDMGDSTHCISALRDPFIFYEGGRYHLLFAARYSRELYDQLAPELKAKHAADSTHVGRGVGFDPEVNSTIGYATSRDLKAWELERPFMLPANATQFELPAMTKTDRGHVLTVAVSNGSVAISDPVEGYKQLGSRHQYLLGFQSSAGADGMTAPGAWSSLEPKVGKETHPLSKIYGPNFLPVGDQVLVSAFDETTHDLINVVAVSKEGFPANIPNQDSAVWDLP